MLRVLIFAVSLFFSRMVFAADYTETDLKSSIYLPAASQLSLDNVSITNSRDLSSSSSSGFLFFGTNISQSFTFTNSGSIANSAGDVIKLEDFGGSSGASVSIVNSGTMSSQGSTSALIQISGSSSFALNLTNSGTISSESGSAIDATQAAVVITNSSGGTISGADNSINISGTSAQLVNEGTISGGTNSVYISSDNVSITNSGAINSSSSGSIYVAGDSVVINNSGAISSTGDNSVYVAGDNVEVVNSGSLSSANQAIYIAGDNANFSNSGAISSTTDQTVYIAGSGASVSNSGTISSAGEAIVISGSSASVTNSGTVSGGDNLVKIDGSGATFVNSGAIDGGDASISISGSNASFVNTGSVNGDQNSIYVVGDNVTISNSGEITSSSGSDAIIVTGNNFTLSLLTGSDISGSVSASGTGNVLDIQIANLTVDQLNSITSLISGDWSMEASSGASLTIAENETVDSFTLSGDSSISNSGSLGDLTVSGSGNELTLDATSSTGNIANTGALTISVEDSNGASYSSAISGVGSLTKSGSGTLTLDGTSTYYGATTVSEGELKVNGDISSSAVTVFSGAEISGSGTVGSLNINSGADLSPGDGIGQISVDGFLFLNSGANTNFQFSETQIDKIVTTGNVTLSGTANFNLSGTDGYFVIDQDIIETTGGKISGTFESVETDSDFITTLTYGSDTVSARIIKDLDSNTVDGSLSSQSALTRILTRSVTDKIRELGESKKAFNTWFSRGSFNASMGATTNSAAYSLSGNLYSAGLVFSHEGRQIFGGFFNSQSNVSRKTYLGTDAIDSNGVVFGVTKKRFNNFGKFYDFFQGGLSFYDFSNKRYVEYNGDTQTASGSGSGQFFYLNAGTVYDVPEKIDGDVNLFGSLTLQKTSHGGWQESGLESSNFSISNSSVTSANFEIGSSYKNDINFGRKFYKGGFYRFNLTLNKVQQISSQSATVSNETSSSKMKPQLVDSIIYGFGAYSSIPISNSSAINLKFDKKKSGNFNESIFELGLNYKFESKWLQKAFSF